MMASVCFLGAVAQGPTVGCDNNPEICPQNTSCIEDMCYTVVAAPPDMESTCNEAFCSVEQGGKCVDGKCVVLQDGIGLGPAAKEIDDLVSTDMNDASGSSGLTWYWMICTIAVSYMFMNIGM